MEVSSLHHHSTPMNGDCWLEVFNLLVSTKNIVHIWRLMCVCKALYTTGMPILVRMWSNILPSECVYDPACVARFCRFMLSGDGMRLKHLRKLDVADILAGPMWDQDLIFRVISQAVHLEELEVDGDLLCSYLQDSNTLHHFDRLASLTLRSANDVGHTLQDIHARIERLTLDFDDVDDELEEDDEELPDSFSLIFPFRDSVKEVRVTNGWLDDTEVPFACNRLTSLQLENTFIPPIGQLAHIFPNLQRLDASFCFSEQEGDQFRAINERSQQRGYMWRHLDFVSVHRPGFLYGLALTCTARCVAFELVDGSEEVELAASLLAIMRPTSLRVGSRSVGSLQHVLTPVLSAVTSCVSELHIIVDMSQESGLLHTIAAMAIDSVFYACSTLQLTHFMLTACGPRAKDSLPLSELEQYIRDYDLEALAYRLVNSFPTLEFVRLCFSRQSRAYWRVVDDATTRSSQPISRTLGDSLTRAIFPIAARSEAAFDKD